MGKMIYQQILPYLPSEIREILLRSNQEKLEELEELRLRPSLPAICRFAHDEAFLARRRLFGKQSGGWESHQRGRITQKPSCF